MRYCCTYCSGLGRVYGPPPKDYHTIQGKVDCPMCVEKGLPPRFEVSDNSELARQIKESK